MSDIPRRIQMQQWCEAERKIYDAMQAVEAMAADVRLTDAVVLLGAARDRVADFVDGVEGKRTVPSQVRGEAPPEYPGKVAADAAILSRALDARIALQRSITVRDERAATAAKQGIAAIQELEAALSEVWVRGEAGPLPPGLDEKALAAAERAYWKDDGVSRHNLAAAILTYLEAVRAGPLPPSPEAQHFEEIMAKVREDRRAGRTPEQELRDALTAIRPLIERDDVEDEEWCAAFGKEVPILVDAAYQFLGAVRGVVPAPPPETPENAPHQGTTDAF